MRTSPSISNLSKALLVAQKQMGAAVKGAKNPFFKSSYADLPTVMEVVKGPLNDAGIVILQPATTINGKNYITTTLIHAETGEFASSDMEIICKSSNNPQDFGAATTYTRRFSLQSMLFTPAEDDDGETAMGRGKAKPAYVPPAAKTESSLIVSGNSGTIPAATGPTPQHAITAKTDVHFTNLVPTVTEVQPLKTSSFRKQKTPAAQPAASDDGWNS